MKLLSKRAEDRYQTAAGIEADLRLCLAQWEANGCLDDFPLAQNDSSDRLHVPETLYGRTSEVETLLAAFDRVASGSAPEFILVSGYSGIGKSSVVNELQPVLASTCGLFASGKFDQHKRDIPYATLAEAFRNLARSLLGQREEDIAPWRDALRGALGPNAALMTDLVPELELIVGDLPPVPELPPQDAQRRFHLAFRQLVGVFARPEHPLALFLDDLQWVDPATLELLDDLLSWSELRHLLIVGAFRDNEVAATHSLARKLEAIRASGRVQEIKLGPLTTDDVGQLVADSLHIDAASAAPLADLVHEKTDGNPFFVLQFLQMLVDEGLVAFDHRHARWSFDLTAVLGKRHTDNVVDLLVAKLSRLPLETQEALRQFACVGNAVDIAVLSIVLGLPEERVHAALWDALRLQLIERSDRAYRFAHDRVQEAAYGLIPEASRAKAHLKIGRLLAAQTPSESRNEAIFDIVSQLNRGAVLIASGRERLRLANLNLAAGRRAMSASAYASALTYLAAGAALLPDDAWARHQETAFALELNLAECEVCTGALQAAEERLAALAMRAVDTTQHCAVARRRVDLYTMRGASEQAVAVALQCLRRVGIDLPAHPTEADARREYERFWSQLGSRAIESIVELPLLEDAETLATLDLLVRLSMPALYTDEPLYAVSVCKAARLALEHGNSDVAPYGYAIMGLIASARFGRRDEGYRLAKMACDLLEHRGWHHLGGRTYFFLAATIPWTRPLQEAIEPARRAFRMAEEHGDPAFAAFASRSVTSILLGVGHPLNQVEREAEQAAVFLQPFGLFLDRISAPLALVRTLRGATAEFGSLDDGQVTEAAFEQRLTGQAADAFLECYYWIRKLRARFFAGDYAGAVAAADKAGEWRDTSAALGLFLMEMAEFHFYAALSCAARCGPEGPASYASHRATLRRHLDQLEAWTASCPHNFEDRAALVAAEIARLEGRPLEAMDAYERAIVAARENGFVHHEAIASELAASFYAGRGFATISNAYLRQARGCYLSWGADGKVRRLEALHPVLRELGSGQETTPTIAAPLAQLDFATVIKASQTVSGEVELEKLIDALMRLAIEHAGAERGLLLLSHGDLLRLEAEASTRGDDIVVRRQNASATELPASIAQYVLRTRDTLILGDASVDPTYASDPYVREHKAKSILCLPLATDAKVTGALYLENNLVPHVFTPDRVAVLKVLASQAAISLENSRLYHDLSNREGRIRRLVDANILGVCIWKLDGAILEANDAFLRMLQYEREDVLSGRVRWTDQTPLQWRELDERTIVELRSTGTFQPVEKEYYRKDGSRVPVLIGGALLEENGDEGVAFVLDLTELKRIEKALRASEERFRDYAETASDWLWETGPDYKFTLLTENAFGSDPARRMGTACWDHARDLETEPEKWRLVREALDARRPFRDFVYCTSGGNGLPMYVKASGRPVFDAHGNFTGYRGTGSDVTGVIHAEEALSAARDELTHAARMMTFGALTASIAHEVNQPLAGILANAETAIRNLTTDPPDIEGARDAARRTIRDANRAADVISRQRSLFTKKVTAVEPVDINEAAQDIVLLSGHELRRNKVAILTEFEADLPQVLGDRVQIQQVILNLLLNASDALRGVVGLRRIVIRTERDRVGGVRLTVRDNGPGIDPQTADRMFDAFYTTKDSGMGIGLSISRSIIERHGGRLVAEQTDGPGASFVFNIPPGSTA
jgi:PAS domain S-box-containing protein